LKSKGVITKHIVSFNYHQNDIANVTIGGYHNSLLAPQDQNKSILWHRMTLDKTVTYGHVMKVENIKLASNFLTKQLSVHISLSNTAQDLHLYTSKLNVYKDFDDVMTKIFPQVICKEDTVKQDVKCFLPMQQCSKQNQSLTFEIEDYIYTIGSG